MSARTFLSSAFVFAVAVAVHAQTARPAFEAASIKRNLSGEPYAGNRNLPGGRVTVTNQRLRQIIRSAYGANDIEVIGGPSWLDDDRWDIVATAGNDERDAPWREMLKTLLAERFKLVAHVEQRDRPIYGLVFARTDKQLGPKIHTTACTGDVCGNTSANTSGLASGTITGTSRTMAEIGRSLSSYAGRRVFDRTGLQERYDFEVTWSEDVSIFTGLQEQLGLRLDPQRASVDVVVVDSAERAAED